MTRSFIVDPETGKLLTAREWKDKAGDNVKSAKMVAIVPEDGTPFAFPVAVFGNRPWGEAMKLAEGYKAPHAIDGSDGTFTLATRKQWIDIRDARSAGLEQLLEMIGADDALCALRQDLHWTRDPMIPAGRSESVDWPSAPGLDPWSSELCPSGDAWACDSYGSFVPGGITRLLAVRPATLLTLDP